MISFSLSCVLLPLTSKVQKVSVLFRIRAFGDVLIPSEQIRGFHTVDTVHLGHIKLSYRPTDAH